MAQTLVVAPAFDLLDQAVGIASIDASAAVPTSTDLNFLNSGSEVLLISAGATGLSATVKAQPDPYGRGGGNAGGGGDDNDVTTVIPSGGIALIPFANPAMFNAGGVVSVVLTNITTCKVLLIRMRKNR